MQLYLLTSEMPKEKEVSKHENHTFDGNYCYECQVSIDEETEPCIGNSLYNQCLSELKSKLVTMEIDEDKLTKLIYSSSPILVCNTEFEKGFNDEIIRKHCKIIAQVIIEHLLKLVK